MTEPTTAQRSCGFQDAECGGYAADLPLWLALAETTGGPILDLGAGTGRVSLPLAAAGYDVTAVDLDPDLLDALLERATVQRLTVSTCAADLRELDAALLGDHPPARLVLIPMQTIQLLGGSAGRRAMFRGAAAVAAPGAELVVSIVTDVESFDGRDQRPQLLPPDIAVLDGWRFDSTPLAVLQEIPGGQIDMHRRRVFRRVGGEPIGDPEDVVISLDGLDVETLHADALAGGWSPMEVVPVPATDDHAGGTIVIVRRIEPGA